MFLTDVVVIAAGLIFLAAIAVELSRDRDKKMYVGREAKSLKESQLPATRSESQPPVPTREDLNRP